MEQQQGLVLPVLALRGLTSFPKMRIHFDAARQMSVAALEESMKSGQTIFLTSQKKISTEKPKFSDLHKVGTICVIKQIIKLPDNAVRVLVEGKERAIIIREIKNGPFLQAEVIKVLDENVLTNDTQNKAIARKLFDAFDEYLDLQPKVTPDLMTDILDKVEPHEIADSIAQNIPIDNNEKQRILEERNPIKRAMRVIEVLSSENEILEIEQEISLRVKQKIDKNQREYYLKEQLKVVSDELYGEQDISLEYENYLEKIKKLKITENSKQKLIDEAKKMRRLGNSAHESAVIRNYLDFVISMPFSKTTKDKDNIKKAKEILDADHYGMEKVKERILEILAIRKVSESKIGTGILLVGPPGVGKTTIAKSIVKSMGRKMARVSLGGVRDEAEIRGHRKTYVSAMSGKIVKALRDANTSNPVILLDEIDKMASDMRGDPSAAMLEVLDFEQNHEFSDHFMEIPTDLSKVIFVATANNVNSIPKPLLDRLEVIELSSYTNVEKFHIAKDYIIKKSLKKHGLKRVKVSDSAINDIIKHHTRESGVRKLEQKIEEMMRKIALKIVTEDQKTFNIDKNIEDYIGKARYHEDSFSKKDQIGIVNGLAYTSVGGTILRVEVNALKGDGKLKLTGNLGAVMKESAEIAMSYIKSISDSLNIADDYFKKHDLHIHFPEGAVPKDGPSAGITMATAIISAITEQKVYSNVAMTGEISLRGNVMPIGGLREKSMAAYQYGMKKVLISSENVKDLEEIDAEVLENVEFVVAEDMKTVLLNSLVNCDVKSMTNEILSRV